MAENQRRVRIGLEHETAERLAKIMLSAVHGDGVVQDNDQYEGQNRTWQDRRGEGEHAHVGAGSAPTAQEAANRERAKARGRWVWERIEETKESVSKVNSGGQRSVGPAVRFSDLNAQNNPDRKQVDHIRSTSKPRQQFYNSSYPYDSAVYVRSLMERPCALPGEETPMRDVCADSAPPIDSSERNIAARGVTSAEKRLARAALGPLSMMYQSSRMYCFNALKLPNRKYIIIPLAVLFAGLLLFCKDGKLSVNTNFDVYDLCKSNPHFPCQNYRPLLAPPFPLQKGSSTGMTEPISSTLPAPPQNQRKTSGRSRFVNAMIKHMQSYSET